MNFSNLRTMQQLYILLASTAVEDMHIAPNMGITYSAPVQWTANNVPEVPKSMSDKLKLSVDAIHTLGMMRVTFDKQESTMNHYPRFNTPASQNNMTFVMSGDKVSVAVALTQTDKAYSEIANAQILHVSKSVEFTIDDASKETLVSLLKFLRTEVYSSESDACKALARIIESYDDVVNSLDSEIVRSIVEYRSVKQLWVNVSASMRLNPDLERYQPNTDCDNCGEDRAELSYTSINSTYANTLLGSYISSVPHHNLHTVELLLIKQGADDKYKLVLRQQNFNSASIVLSERLVEDDIKPEDFVDVMVSVFTEANDTTKGPGYVNDIINVMSNMLEQNREFIISDTVSHNDQLGNGYRQPYMPNMLHMPRH